MEPEHFSPATLSRLPVLALPSTVLFPGTVLPLHVTDAETIELLEDTLAGDGAVGVVLPDPKAAPSRTHAPLCEVGCIGRVIHAEKLPNGPYNILIEGRQRIRLRRELPPERSYRCFQVELIPDPTEAALESASRELGRLESCIMSLRSSIEDRDAQLCEVLRSTSDPVRLADVLAAAVVADPDVQQRLLAAQDVRQRVKTLIDALAEVMVREGQPPKQAQMN